MCAPCATFSLILRDPRTGRLGSAVASKYLAVGGAVVHAQPGVGTVHAQFWCCHDTAHRVLRELATGAAPDAALAQALAADPLPHKRQVLVMDMQGRAAIHTGAGCGLMRGAVREVITVRKYPHSENSPRKPSVPRRSRELMMASG